MATLKLVLEQAACLLASDLAVFATLSFIKAILGEILTVRDLQIDLWAVL